MIRCSDKILIFFAFIISLGVVFNNGVSATGYGATFLGGTADIEITKEDPSLCIQCSSNEDSGKPGFKCDSAGVASLGDIFTCTLGKGATECLTYQYIDEQQNIVTKRNCSVPDELTCKILKDEKLFGFLQICNSCTNDVNEDEQSCNGGALKSAGKCYKCNSDEEPCTKDEITEDDGVETCDLDDTVHQKCIAYKYIDDKDGKYKTYRGCVPEGTNSIIELFPNTTINFECSEKDRICNNKFDNLEDEKKVCIQCSSEEADSKCSDDEVSNLNKDNFCTLDVDKNQCITYRYKDAEGKQVTKRGCEAPDKCASLLKDKENPLDLCNTCEGEACNRQMSTEGKCYQCNSDETECSDEEINDTKMKQCYLDQTVHTLCVAYKYFGDNGKINTHRGCSDETNLDAISKSTTTITTKNLDCKTNQCNKNAIDKNDEKNICIKCSSEDDGTKCTETELSGLSDDNFVVFKDTESECVVYKYTEGTGDAKKEIIQRNVVPKTESCNVLYEEKFDTLELCTSCNTIGCNSKKPEVNGKQCYKCSSEIISACENLETLEKCPLGDSIHQTCVQYKYIDGKDGKYKTYRGCAPAGTVEEIKNYPNTTIAYDCEDNLCNGKFSDIPDKTMYSVCVQCNSDKDENCRESEVSNFNQENFCRLEGEANECLTYKYTILNADNKSMDIVERGCLKESLSCSSLYNEKFDDLHLCDSCNNDLVNDNEGCNKKALTGTGTDCYKCNTDDDDKKCNDEIKDEDNVEKCELDTTVHKKCITYKYLDNSNGDIKIYRGCAPEKREDLKNETIITVDCEDALCNANFNKSDEKIFCIKCSSADNSTTCNKDEAKNVEYCRLEEDETCIGYSYGSANDLIERNCVKIESGCEAMIESNKLSGPLKTCTECTNGQFCNLKLNKTIINGAISTTPIISLSLLSLCFSLYYLLFN